MRIRRIAGSWPSCEGSELSITEIELRQTPTPFECWDTVSFGFQIEGTADSPSWLL